MVRKSQDYWEERNTKMMLHYEKMTENTINTLIKAYNKALENISKEIAKTFNNYAKDGLLTNERLKVLLNEKQSDSYQKKLLEIINTIDDGEIKKRILAKYNAPAYAFRISRYEQLRSTIDVELKKLAVIEKKINQDTYENIINDGYYRTIYEIQKGTSLGFSFSEIDTKTLKMMLSEKWIDKANFSERIWKNSEKLSDYISTNLLASNISGKSIKKISKELSEAMNVGLYNATTLIRTEVNHFANESEMLAYEECEIEKYRFIATLDKITCDHCGELDNKVFDVKDRKAGKNYPPIHPNDRCTTVAEFDDDVTECLERRAKNENGKSIIVPQDMSYKEWAMQYAPEQYKKYYINPNLPKTKSVVDGVLDKQLGFYNESNNLKFIPKSSIISNVHIIAGDGTQTVFRSANKYAQLYGGKAQEWTKRAGKIESDKYVFDIHWVEHIKYGKYDFKLKGKTLK